VSSISADRGNAVFVETTATISSKLINVITKTGEGGEVKDSNRSNEEFQDCQWGVILGFNALTTQRSVIAQNFLTSIMKIFSAL